MEQKNSSIHHLCYVTLKRSLKKVTLMRIGSSLFSEMWKMNLHLNPDDDDE